MTRESFYKLLEKALETAAQNAERAFGVNMPRNFRIELHTAAYRGQLVNLDTAVNGLYLGTQFYGVIEVSIREANLDDRTSLAVVRALEGPLVTLEQTFNYAQGMGPFKQVLAYQLKVLTAQFINLPANYKERF